MAGTEVKPAGTICNEQSVFHGTRTVSTPGEGQLRSPRLTPKQIETLEAVRAHVRRFGVAPSRLELCKVLNVKHQGSIEARLQGLAKRGWLELLPFVERGIKLLREGTPVVDPELVPMVSAGTPILAEEYGDVVRAPDFESGWTPFDSKPDYFVRVKGDSMDRAGFNDGDVVAVRQNPEPNEGDLVIARIGQDVTMKRYHRRSEDVIELQPVSDNPEHHPIRIEADTEDFEIAGVVVGAMIGARRSNTAN